jgi:hypothetical protein
MVGIRGFNQMGGGYRVPLGPKPPWETAFERDPEWREFAKWKQLRSPGYSQSDVVKWWNEYSFKKQLKRDLANKRERKRRESIYAAHGMEYNPSAGSIRSFGSSGPSQKTLKRRAEREAKRAEMKSKQAEKADAKKLREIEQKGRDLLKKRDDYATRPGYGEEVARLNEQLAELAFERDYLAGRSPTLKTAEERRREQAESASEIASREALTQQRLTGIERDKEADKVRREVSTWIARNPDSPAVAEIQKLLSQSKLSGVDSLAIVLQAKALADKEAAEVAERARLQTEKLQAMNDAREDSQAHARQMAEFRARESTGAKSETQRLAFVENIQQTDVKIAGLRAMIQDAESADPNLEPKIAGNLPGAKRDLSGLLAERQELIKMYQANYGTYTETAMTGGRTAAAQPQSQWSSAEDVIAAFQAGNIPRQMALNILIEQFGYEP